MGRGLASSWKGGSQVIVHADSRPRLETPRTCGKQTRPEGQPFPRLLIPLEANLAFEAERLSAMSPRTQLLGCLLACLLVSSAWARESEFCKVSKGRLAVC